LSLISIETFFKTDSLVQCSSNSHFGISKIIKQNKDACFGLNNPC